MKLAKNVFFCSIWAMISVYCVATPLAAQAYKTEKLSLPAPQELSSGVREVLVGDALRVSGPNGVLCEVWLRKAVPTTSTPSQDKGIAFGQIAEGTLIGAIRFPNGAVDYRGTGIKPGVYTLRYALIPEDGNHLGAAPPQRDFLLLGPAADDGATSTRDQTLDLSRKVTGMLHPTVWSLSPSKLSAADLPAMTHQDDPDCRMLNFPLTFQGGKTVPAALVVHGQAQS